jgi:hypothetical protein
MILSTATLPRPEAFSVVGDALPRNKSTTELDMAGEIARKIPGVEMQSAGEGTLISLSDCLLVAARNYFQVRLHLVADFDGRSSRHIHYNLAVRRFYPSVPFYDGGRSLESCYEELRRAHCLCMLESYRPRMLTSSNVVHLESEHPEERTSTR